MRTWNLSTLGDLETPVTVSFQKRPAREIARDTRVSRVKSVLHLAMVSAVISATVHMSIPHVSSASTSIQSSGISVAQSIPRAVPPLSNLFAGSPIPDWSLEQENLALEEMAKKFSPEAVKFDEAEMVDVALANQQDSLGPEVPRLSKEQVLRVIKRRRSS